MDGYAGIRVPWIDKNRNGEKDLGEYATLNVYGENNGEYCILEAHGGNGSNGGEFVAGDAGGGRRSVGAGARNWTVTGGNGGNSNMILPATHKKRLLQSGGDGKDGEDCGNINIEGKIKVYAFGGKGGSSGTFIAVGAGSGTGARRLSCCSE